MQKPEKILDILRPAFKPFLGAAETGDYGRGFRFLVSKAESSIVIEFPSHGWYSLVPLLLDDDIELENFIKRARGLVEERLQEIRLKIKLDPWELSQ